MTSTRTNPHFAHGLLTTSYWRLRDLVLQTTPKRQKQMIVMLARRLMHIFCKISGISSQCEDKGRQWKEER
jgi:hypothetical protein